MYLSRIAVQNFRNLDALSVDLTPGLNVIVGENNVGKTNLLDALLAAVGATAVTGDPVKLSKDDLHRGVDGKTTDAPIRVDLIFAELSEDEQAQFIDLLNYNATSPVNSTASIHFEWSWNESARRWHIRRWAGDRPNSEAAVPDDVLQSIPVTLLGALRNALSGLVPGRQSRLGRLLSATAADSDKTALVEIVEKANDDLQKAKLITTVESKIVKALQAASGPTLSQDATIRASEPDFDRIVHNLRLVLKLKGLMDEKGKPLLEELRANGLGYNNLLFIATVLAELKASADATLPLLLVEEPEAHLHPQLQTLLADFLERGGFEPGENTNVQTIITTHSPTIAAYVPPKVVRVLHKSKSAGLRCVALGSCGLVDREMNQLRRMLDVTKAALLFARGVVLVEGVSEAMLVPVLARRMDLSLEERSISVIPVCGVDFSTIGKLFSKEKLTIPVAMVTDADPPVEWKGGDWRRAQPKTEIGGVFAVSNRVVKLEKEFKDNSFVDVLHSKVTLEYDLAEAGDKNADLMCEVWEGCFDGKPETFNREILKASGGTNAQRALATWRGICLSSTTRGKGEFAQALAEKLDERNNAGEYKTAPADFIVPEYIKKAIDHVITQVS